MKSRPTYRIGHEALATAKSSRGTPTKILAIWFMLPGWKQGNASATTIRAITFGTQWFGTLITARSV